MCKSVITKLITHGGGDPEDDVSRLHMPQAGKIDSIESHNGADSM